ncbi:MAG: hypothetical protein ACFE85_17175 [Candidatus Hodarchaeota archaeon]
MKIKEIIIALKPVNWFKGAFMVLIGILNTRLLLGIGRVANNIFIGLPTYFLISISMMLTVLIFKISSESSENTLKNVRRIGFFLGITYLISYSLSIYYVIVLNLNYLSLFIVALIGVFLLISIYYKRDWEKKSLLVHVIESLSYSFGIIYGGVLNTLMIPIYIYLFFAAAFLTQFCKDIITSYKYVAKDRVKNELSFPITFGIQKTQQVAFILELIIILSLLLPLFIDIYNAIMYLIPMIFMLVIFGVISFLTLKLDLEHKYRRFMNLLFKAGIFFEILAFILASF